MGETVSALRLSRASLFLGIALAVITLDQLAKNVAIESLVPYRFVPVIGEWFGWRLVYNDSAAFSIGFGYTWIFAITSTIAALVAIWYGLRISDRSWLVMLGVFLGGIVGNLIDRLIREPSFGNGHVVDYIQIPFNFPVFNIADIAIVSMALLAVLRVFRGERIGGLAASGE